MEFNNNKPIYIQISDNFCNRILTGEYKVGGRIPSVREWAAEIGVNPNTVARSYELLTDRGIIDNHRGIGFFVSESAADKILSDERKTFIDDELPVFLRRAELLGINLKDYLK